MKGFFNLISSSEFTDLFQNFHALETERVPLHLAYKRTLAEDITAQENLPPFARSTMDGFAVRAKDTFGCSESEPALLEIIGEIPMGSPGTAFTLRPGQAVRIWTGGQLPNKGDGVVMVEYSHLLDEHTVEIFRPIAPGQNSIRAGEDYEQGAIVLEKGRQVRPADLGVLAGLGITQVSVYCQPKVGIISTGDELVAPDQQPGPGQIRDINSTTLMALVEEAGGTAQHFGIVPDDLQTMRTVCAQALEQVDVLLFSGGSSVGRRDFTLQVFEQVAEAEVLAHGVSIRPGKPTILARRDNQALFGLPGHVASAMVVFYLFVRPLLHLLTGRPCKHAADTLQVIQAETGQQIPSTIGREEYVRVSLSEQGADLPPLAQPLYGKSGLLNPLVNAHGLLVIGRDIEGLDQGVQANVLLFPS